MRQISTALGYEVSHAHCGVIELLLGLGVIGLSLFIISLIFSLLNLKYFEKKSPEKVFFLIFLVYLAIINLANSAASYSEYNLLVVFCPFFRLWCGAEKQLP